MQKQLKRKLSKTFFQIQRFTFCALEQIEIRKRFCSLNLIIEAESEIQIRPNFS
ncbi:hypothetical protein LEP1GSC008_2298 [Leptospira kirschneri serovar Bulgarica str. Nikolaevo]|uniref:Uncharacterized protein n=1 Tax=Leptospira kirschneri serovar Bulgarica str. Nikolaevo TaxID=1240687 RepID=M6F6Q0_9LEPT|nr:hypothetical protein LEP1GSC008_2298 [Leptospira kirschneri serovar Bulgarica str. Nikolaevo]